MSSKITMIGKVMIAHRILICMEVEPIEYKGISKSTPTDPRKDKASLLSDTIAKSKYIKEAYCP